jgi:hypothetical protein
MPECEIMVIGYVQCKLKAEGKLWFEEEKKFKWVCIDHAIEIAKQKG